MSTYAPFPGPTSSPPDEDENRWWQDREISLIRNLLESEGELPRKEIGERLGCKYWGPLRFRAALKAGVDSGAFTRTSRGHYGPAR
jgi:hypothetical protein